MDRRSLLFGLTALTGAFVLPRGVVAALPRRGLPKGTPSAPTAAEGLTWAPLVSMGDRISADGATAGTDADFLAVFPEGRDRLLLWVNHEYPPEHASVRRALLGSDRPFTPTELRGLMGGSLCELRREGRGWALVADSTRAFRIDGNTEGIGITGPAREVLGERGRGTISNCGGGVTPWGTVLTCEENMRYHVLDPRGVRDGRIGTAPAERFPFPVEGRGEEFGWVVEVDPRDRTFVRRHTALGRFRHEGAAVRHRHGSPLRVYMAEDRDLGGVWRYTSRARWTRGMGRDAASALLTDGVLEIARLAPDGTGEWVRVDRASPVVAAEALLTHLGGEGFHDPGFAAAGASARTLGEVYASDAALLVDAATAGLLAGGTGLGRPEGCILDGDAVLVAITTALKRALPAGHPSAPPVDHAPGLVLRIVDEGATLLWSAPVLGVASGEDGWGRPDNVGLDLDGALLVATDADVERPEVREAWGHNALLRVESDGAVHRLLLAPDGAEVCAPVAAPDRSGLFCTIQHPNPTWNEGRSAVIVVTEG